MTDATLGASGLWLETRTGAGGNATLTESFFLAAACGSMALSTPRPFLLSFLLSFFLSFLPSFLPSRFLIAMRSYRPHLDGARTAADGTATLV